ncbi:MAG: hypothetical protein ACYC26_15540 [Phycisphaerales bacterium]
MLKNILIIALVLFLVIGCLDQGRIGHDEGLPMFGPDVPILSPHIVPDAAVDHLDVYQTATVKEG